MIERKYDVYLDEEKIASDMRIHDALIFVETLFDVYEYQIVERGSKLRIKLSDATINLLKKRRTNNMEDKFKKPDYYVSGRKIEPKDVIIYINCDFFIGNVIKYISRAGRKPGSSFIDDISKAAVYTGFEIDKMNEEEYSRWYTAVMNQSSYTDFYWNSVIEDWGFNESDNTEANLCKELMKDLYSYLIESDFDLAKLRLKCIQDFINRYISKHTNTVKLNPSSDFSIDYKNGWNDAIKEAKHVATVDFSEDDVHFVDTDYSKDYINGWNAALEEVIEYLHSAHGGDSFVSKSELIGHCDASKK